jgi:predicted phage terminase large subunit-like protein
VVGVDPNRNLYVADWYYDQKETDIWVEELINLIQKWGTIQWAGEAGQIKKAMGPLIRTRMQERGVYCHIEEYVSSTDKVTRAQPIRGRCSMHKVFFPRTPWADRLIKQMLAFPNGTYDDGVDVLSIIGRMMDVLYGPEAPPIDEPEKPKYIFGKPAEEAPSQQKDFKDLW